MLEAKKKSRKERKEERRKFRLVRAKDLTKIKSGTICAMNSTCTDLKQFQVTNVTLAMMQNNAKERTWTRIFWRRGILYQRWKPAGKGAAAWINQFVLPMKCRQEVLKPVHSIPMEGQLGKKKITSHKLKRFYWPTGYRDVAEFSRSCPVGQRFGHQQMPRAPLLLLPLIAEPFHQIAMDIVRPLPWNCAGK